MCVIFKERKRFLSVGSNKNWGLMKMIRKKLVISSLICMASASIITGCGPSSDSSKKSSTNSNKEKKELLIWEDKSKTNGIADAIKVFEKENGVTITVVEKTYADQIEDLRMDGPAGIGADVISIPGDQIGTAVTEGLLKELNVSDSEKMTFTETAMQSQIVNGKVYGLPKAVETTLLYYNKDIISEESLPKTLDEWYDISKTITKDGKYGLLALWDQIYYAQSLFSAYGGYVFAQDSDGNYNTDDIGLNNEGAIKAADYLKKFYNEKLFPLGIIGEQGISVLDTLFTEGKAAAVISGPWNLEPYKQAGINYGVVELPTISSGEHLSAFLGVKSYNVSSYSKNGNLAEKFVKYITNEENSKVRYQKTQEVPAVKALSDDPVITKSQSAEAVAKQSQFSELTPNIPEMAEVWDPANSALQLIVTGKADTKKALDDAVKTIKGQIKANHSSNK